MHLPAGLLRLLAAALAATAIPALAQVGAPAPAGLPTQGDTWTYRFTERKPIGAPTQRQYHATVSSVSATTIVEKYAIEGGPSGEWIHSSSAYLVPLGASVFSPYLAAFRDLSAQPGLDRVEINDRACTGRAVCNAHARVVGRETVRVPAGSFETVYVKVVQSWSERSGSGTVAGERELYVWYAPALKRAVKFSSRRTSGAPAPFDTEFELELVAYKVEGAVVPPVAAPAKPAQAEPAPAPSDLNVEIVFWESIRASKDPADFRAYLDQYPQGRFAALARNRLAALGEKPAPK